MPDPAVVNGHAAMNASRGIGIALTFVLGSQIYPFMLSSAFTARTIVQEKNQVQEVITDMKWAFVLDSIASLIIAYFMHEDWVIAAFGVGFGTLLFIVYLIRGQIPLEMVF